VITCKLALADDPLQQAQAVFDTAPELIERFLRKDILPYTQGLVTKRLRKAPGPAHYPIQWTSEKQRKAFFATDGFGSGIPYQRTDGMIHDWHVRVDRNRGFTSLLVMNDNPAARYVYGDEHGLHQQRFHLNTGWPTYVQELQAISLTVNDRIDERLPNVLAEAFLGETRT
jgi:hypothetical protein